MHAYIHIACVCVYVHMHIFLISPHSCFGAMLPDSYPPREACGLSQPHTPWKKKTHTYRNSRTKNKTALGFGLILCLVPTDALNVSLKSKNMCEKLTKRRV
ncbi:hypothetical protein FKM82_016029 [Ascaphus truei]